MFSFSFKNISNVKRNQTLIKNKQQENMSSVKKEYFNFVLTEWINLISPWKEIQVERVLIIIF